MAVFKIAEILIALFVIFKPFSAQRYAIPDVTFDVLKSGGFRVSVPDVEGTRTFNFSANINADVSAESPAKIYGAVSTPTSGVFLLQFDDLLKVGDTVNYKVFVSFGRLGYTKTKLKFTVADSDLHEAYAPLGPTCRTGSTTINGGKKSCIGELIITDEFDGTNINTNTWIIEQKITTYEDVYNELNYYVSADDTRFLKDGILHLKPVGNDEKIRGDLDLRTGCTAKTESQCFYKQRGAFIIPPVKSGRITSKIPFKYGKIEIKAKLPAGDWLIPVLQLESQQKTTDGFTPKMFIAYSRGNDHLVGSAGDDIGGRLLYAGPVLNIDEPGRSGKLETLASTTDVPFSGDYHTYTLEWLPGKMSYYLDSRKYGTIDTSKGFSEFNSSWNTPDAPFDKECLLSLGVSVGGVGEFPDNYMSGNNPKPWTYTAVNFMRSFYDQRSSWLPTWKGDDVSLRVDYVKVWAV